MQTLCFTAQKLLLHIVNRSATIDVSLKLWRFQVVCTETKEKYFFSYKNTHTYQHSPANTHPPCIHLISARLCNCKNTQSVDFFQRRRFHHFFFFSHRSTIQYVDNKRFDCLNMTSTHLKSFIECARHSCALIVCISDTLVNRCSGAPTFLFLVCKNTLCQSLLWRCRSTLVCAFIGFGQ